MVSENGAYISLRNMESFLLDDELKFLKVTVESIKEMHLPHGDEEKIFFKNAQNLFKIR